MQAVVACLHDLLAAPAALGDQAGSFEYRDMLLHSSKTHRVLPRELGDRVLPSPDAPQDITAGWVGERLEELIGVAFWGEIIYNHLVVRYQKALRCPAFAHAWCAISRLTLALPIAPVNDCLRFCRYQEAETGVMTHGGARVKR